MQEISEIIFNKYTELINKSVLTKIYFIDIMQLSNKNKERGGKSAEKNLHKKKLRRQLVLIPRRSCSMNFCSVQDKSRWTRLSER